MSFDKKLSGALIEAPIAMGNGDTLTVKGVGALARGQFARNTFRGQEGNQGPYRLRGNQSELYIIILSGSATIFITEGIQGLTNDYQFIGFFRPVILFGLNLIPYVLSWFLLFLLYMIFPNTSVKARPALIAGILGVGKSALRLKDF